MGRVLYKTNRNGKLWLYGLASLLVPSHQTSGRTISDLPEKGGAHCRMVRPIDLAPNLSIRIAEAGTGTKFLRVEQRERRRTVLCGGLIEIRLAARRLRAFELRF